MNLYQGINAAHREFMDAVQLELAHQPVLVAKIQVQNLPWVMSQYGPTATEQAVEAVQRALEGVQRAGHLTQISYAVYGAVCRNAADPNGLIYELEDAIRTLNYGHEFPFLIEIAVGVVVANPAETTDPQSWVTRANLALLTASREGHGVVYSESLGAAEDLRRAVSGLSAMKIAPSDMTWWFQPIADTTSLEVIGFEALCRWSSATRLGYGPAQFIELAETLGVVGSLDRWTARFVAEHGTQLLTPASKGLGINVSSRTLEEDPMFVRDLELTMNSTGFGMQNLVVELTETATITSVRRMRAALDAIRSTGAHVAIDDFGQGQTNLGTIAQFNFDYLKLDRSLLREDLGGARRDLLVVGQQIADELGVESVLEGVESETDLHRAQDAQISFVQGWYVGMPMNLATATTLIST